MFIFPPQDVSQKVTHWFCHERYQFYWKSKSPMFALSFLLTISSSIFHESLDRLVPT